MKKLLISLVLLVLMLGVSIYSFAANEYNLSIIYSGDVIANEDKNVDVDLTGINGPSFTNVRINVEIAGPDTPKLIAIDSANNVIDIAEVGYWGPQAGFPIQGDFTNTTHITATFPEAGEYTITLNLVDLNDNSAILATTTETVTVLEEQEDIVDNEIEELPTTGTTLAEYTIYSILIAGIVAIVYLRIRKTK